MVRLVFTSALIPGFILAISRTDRGLVVVPLMVAALVLGAMLGECLLGLASGPGRVKLARRLLSAIRRCGSACFGVLVCTAAVCAAVALGFLVMAVRVGLEGEHGPAWLLISFEFAALAAGSSMLASANQPSADFVGRGAGWLVLRNIHSLTCASLWMVAVGLSAAALLHDERATVGAVVAVAVMLLGWGKIERDAAEVAIRRLATATGRALSRTQELTFSTGIDRVPARLAALEALNDVEVACLRRMRGGWFLATERSLVEPEILTVLRACCARLEVEPFRQSSDSATNSVFQSDPMTDAELEREVAVFIADLRRLVVQTPLRPEVRMPTGDAGLTVVAAA